MGSIYSIINNILHALRSMRNGVKNTMHHEKYVIDTYIIDHIQIYYSVQITVNVGVRQLYMLVDIELLYIVMPVAT